MALHPPPRRCFDFYPRSPCGERHARRNEQSLVKCISIHALLAESDAANAALIFSRSHFYPRSPCGERRDRPNNSSQQVSFLSTLSLRRATGCNASFNIPNKDFYPRSPCGERRKCNACAKLNKAFLSTLSLRRATSSLLYISTISKISIHALLAESDSAARMLYQPTSYFYPRSPCGERPPRHLGLSIQYYFYPRSPCGERLWSSQKAQKYIKISIHALLAESDSNWAS